jgi:YD repeat-containing protein
LRDAEVISVSAFDGEGQITETRTPNQRTIQYHYDADRFIDKLVCHSDGEKAQVLFKEGRPQEVDYFSGRTLYEYNDKGSLTAVVEAYGAKTSYFYAKLPISTIRVGSRWRSWNSDAGRLPPP